MKIHYSSNKLSSVHKTSTHKVQTTQVFVASQANKGFTLVELMISLVLGLLISAAALQIFYTSSVNSRRQEASSQIQDNAVFGFAQIQRHLRRANYGAKATVNYDEFFMNHLTPQGGVVLSAPAGTAGKWLNNNLSGLVLDGAAIPADLLSGSAAAASISNLSAVTKSDQLTIQYQAGQEGIFDCQGSAIPKNFYVIERYFVREDSTNASGLACASAIYKYDELLAGSSTGLDIKNYIKPGETTTTANNLAGNGTIIIPKVDYFRVLLGISSSKNFATFPSTSTIGYIPIPSATTMSAALSNNRIVSLQIGILARSNNPTATSQANSALTFSILDKKNVALNTTSNSGPTYLRNVYESTVLLRNARGGL